MWHVANKCVRPRSMSLTLNTQTLPQTAGFLQRLEDAERRDYDRLYTPRGSEYNPQEELARHTDLLAKLRAKPLAVRLGEVLQQKNMRAIDWFRAFDPNADGSINRDEWFDRIQEFGVEATRAETNQLFELLDTDRSQSLTFDKLKPALVKMTSSVQEFATKISHAEGRIERLQRAVEQASALRASISDAEQEASRIIGMIEGQVTTASTSPEPTLRDAKRSTRACLGPSAGRASWPCPCARAVRATCAPTCVSIIALHARCPCLTALASPAAAATPGGQDRRIAFRRVGRRRRRQQRCDGRGHTSEFVRAWHARAERARPKQGD